MPQVKQYMIPSMKNIIYKLFHDLSNDLRLRKLGNNRKMSKLGGVKAWCPDIFPDINFWNCGQKLRRSSYQNFLVLFNFA